MNSNIVEELLERYYLGECTPEEVAWIEDWYDGLTVQDRVMTAEEKNKLADTMKQAIDLGTGHVGEAKQIKFWQDKAFIRKVAVAAAVVLAVTFAVVYFGSKYQDSSIKTRSIYAADVAPGHNGATLTLANGEVIELSDAKNGIIVGEELTYNDGSLISRNGNPVSGNGSPLSPQGGSLPEGERRGGHLSPSGRDVANATERVTTNPTEKPILTATTTKGQTYQITLPDGTKAWLNADSKISFPSQFSEETRKVLISGEVYFEVSSKYSSKNSKGAKVPFIAETKGINGRPGQLVEVLGTHFNINAYADETSIKTTLLEGSVRVSQLNPQPTTHNPQQKELKENPQLKQLLIPGQQSILDDKGIVKKQVDVSEAMAWKNGEFVFEQEPLESILRKVARWYNVEIHYEDEALKSATFSGSVSRYDKVSRVLRKLDLTDEVHFKITGNKIIVTK